MLRRLLSFGRPRLEGNESTDELQKENVHPNIEKIQPKVKKTNVEKMQQDASSNIAEPDTTEKIHNTCDNHDNKSNDKKDLDHVISASCATRESPTPTNIESEAKDCEAVRADELLISDEWDRCESSTSVGDKEESGIEQDFVPKTDKQLVNSKIDHSTTELKKEIDTPCDASLIPINLKSHLKREDGEKTLNDTRVPGTMHQIRGSCERPDERSPIFLPSSNSKKQNSPYRSQYPRKSLVIAPARQPRRNKAPEMFGDIITTDNFTTRAQYSSPLRKGILKNPSSSKYSSTGVKYATSQKKNKLAPSKDKTNSVSSDSGLSDGEASSGEEQKHMPVKKIFSNQQALRKKIDDLNGMLKTMQQQKVELQSVVRIVEAWSEDLRNVDRTSLGVPYIRAVKQTLAKQSAALSSRKSNFNRRLTNLKEAEVPFNTELSKLIQQLRKEITYVVRDQRKYSARSMESIRQLQGRVIGSCTAILAVYYEG